MLYSTHVERVYERVMKNLQFVDVERARYIKTEMRQRGERGEGKPGNENDIKHPHTF